MPPVSASTGGSAPRETPADSGALRLWQVVLIAVVAITFTVAYLSVYALLNNAVWGEGGFLAANLWTVPAGVILFSLLAGLSHKYLHAPDVTHGGFADSLKGGENPDLRTFPGVPVAILVLCIETAALTLALGAPLTVILLVAIVGTADQYTIVLLALSAVTAMLIGARVKERSA